MTGITLDDLGDWLDRNYPDGSIRAMMSDLREDLDCIAHDVVAGDDKRAISSLAALLGRDPEEFYE